MIPERALTLAELFHCFQGVIPSALATADAGGVPNVTFVSQVFLIDERHVALSRQFFNKTSRNLDETRRATVEVHDPLTLRPYTLKLRFLRSETSGALFDTMAMRIQAIASVTGMAGVFRLIGADVFEVTSIHRVDGYMSEATLSEHPEISLTGLRTEIRGLQWISERINRAANLEDLFDSVLQSLEEFFGFKHTMILLRDEASAGLVTMATRGFPESGVGAEVRLGEGLIGTVAEQGRVLRMSALDESVRYFRAVRRETISTPHTGLAAEVPLPGLPGAQSALVIPLRLCDRLVGVLAAQSHNPIRFGEWHEAYLEVIGNQIAQSIERMIEREVEDEPVALPAHKTESLEASYRRRRNIVYYTNDEAMFVDDEYLIRNVPARILRRLLTEWRARGRTEFTNRELRMDASLGLPGVKDNLESRLILLRKRLAEKCADIQIIPSGRGRFSLAVDADVEYVER